MNQDVGAVDSWTIWRQRVDQVLDQQLASDCAASERLLEAMRYACLNGGKRLRAILVYTCAHVYGGANGNADAGAAAVEMVHAYSLIHDDLPAMDDDDLRRGQPSCHRRFDEATAILAGDALQSRAFEVIANAVELDQATRCKMLSILTAAIGPAGMAGGQALDMEAAGQILDVKSLERMHELKTGALITACAELGAISAGVSDTGQLEQLRHYARAVGLAFQITDDILDQQADPALLGKTAGKDEADQKSTYVTLLGLESARNRALKLRDIALASIEGMGDNSAELARIANFSVDRKF